MIASNGVRCWIAGLAASLVPALAWAGPPFLTDDPEPTETGHWEIYVPALDVAGRGADYDGALGAEINFGAGPNLQLTLGLPVAYAHDAAGLHTGFGDLEASVKYRFYRNEETGVSVAVFPGITIPTAGGGLGSRNVTALLPVWAQKDWDQWSVFGGGGYAINPGPGNRDFWTGGVALVRAVSENLVLGVEVDREGADTIAGESSTSLGLGAILQLKPPFRLLASGGPTFIDGGGTTEFHAFVALGLDF